MAEFYSSVFDQSSDCAWYATSLVKMICGIVAFRMWRRITKDLPPSHWWASKRSPGGRLALAAFCRDDFQGAWVARECCRITAFAMRLNPQRAGEAPAKLKLVTRTDRKSVGPKGHASGRQEPLPPGRKRPITATDGVVCYGLA